VPLVVIGRINRRYDTLGSDEPRPFREEMGVLVERGTWAAPSQEKDWLATDLEWDATGNFVTGVIGYQTAETYFRPGEERSWIKARQERATGGTTKTVSPFAIDAREGRQWIAFAQTQHIRMGVFRQAMTALMTVSATDSGLMPATWDVDPIVEAQTVLDWISEHPEVTTLTRIVKFQNPRPESYEWDRSRMRDLNTPRLTETFTPAAGGEINTDSETFAEMLSEAELGYVEIKLVAGRKPHTARFDSATQKTDESIDAYGDDWHRGKSLVLDKLVAWVSRREAEGQQTFVAGGGDDDA
jgi:hypothetical protein